MPPPIPAVAKPQLKSAKGSYDAMPPNAMLCAYLDEPARRTFVDSMMEVAVPKGEVIMRQGDKGNNFYLVKEGTLEVEVQVDGTTKTSRIEAGGGCGEISLLTGQPRAATIMAICSVKLLMVNRKTFNSTIGTLIAKKRSVWNPFLGRVSIFSKDLNEYERGLIADALMPVVFQPGDVISKEGESPPSAPLFYIVREGTVTDTTKKITLLPGDYFGEVELLQKSKNVSTRTAKDLVVCATLTEEQFLRLVPLRALVNDGKNQVFALSQPGGATSDGTKGSASKPMRARRYGESAEVTNALKTKASAKTTVVKSEEALGRIRAAVKRNAIFSALNEPQLKLLQQAMLEHHVPAGANIISQGEKGNHFYVVEQGELNAFVKSADQQTPALVKSFGAGDSFGELALMYNCPRTASITAKTDVVLWSLDRLSFRSIVLEANTKKASMYESFLEKVQLLEPLTKNQRNRMVDALEEVSYTAGERIIGEGEAGTHFYIIVEGEVVITKGTSAAELARRSKGDYFGELSLKTGAPTNASVSASAGGSKVIRMDRGAFQRLLGPLDSLLALRKYSASGVEVALEKGAALSEGGAVHEGGRATSSYTFQKATARLSLADFEVTKDTLGEGAFGKVRRCVYRKTGQAFALKQMVKADIVSMGQVEHIMQETQILSQVTHPFITNKFGALTTSTNLVLIMEFCPGGDMFDQLYKNKRFSLKDATIYSMQVLLPLEYLHGMNIVHRDLKLENLLVAQDGALKLTDFGFAKRIMYRSWTLCGTPEYLAPELILEKGHGKAVDYWALGVLLYEMLNGHSPFEAEETLQTYQKILDGSVNYPANLGSDAKDLISKLLQKDISRRLGNLRDGAKDIKVHPFFKDIDFKSPYHLRGSIRPKDFERNKYQWVGAESVVTETKQMKDSDQALFDNFTA